MLLFLFFVFVFCKQRNLVSAIIQYTDMVLSKGRVFYTRKTAYIQSTEIATKELVLDVKINIVKINIDRDVKYTAKLRDKEKSALETTYCITNVA